MILKVLLIKFKNIQIPEELFSSSKDRPHAKTNHVAPVKRKEVAT